MLTVQTATIASIPVIRELTFNVWPETYSSILTPEQIAYMLDMMYSEAVLKEQMEKNLQQYMLCYNGAKPVGFAAISDGGNTVYKLNKLYVLPQLQGKGVGKLLIEHIAGIIKPLGATTIELNVNRYNSAKDFYEKLGFTIFHEEDIDIGNGYFMNDFVMRLAI